MTNTASEHSMTTLPILTDEERAELKRKAEAATPGYWVHERPTGNNIVRIVVSGKSYLGIARVHAGLKQEDNAAFIAAANPQTILRYEATIEALLNKIEGKARAYDQACGDADRNLDRAEAAEQRAADLEAQTQLLAAHLSRFARLRGLGVRKPNGNGRGTTELMEIQTGPNSYVSDAEELLANLPTAVQAERERVKGLEANQRTPGTVEMCKQCKKELDGFSPELCWRTSANAPEIEPCPIRQQVSPPASESGGGV